MAEKSPAADVEASLLAHLNSTGEVPDSRSFASSLGVSHLELEGVIKSLSAFRIVESTDIIDETWVLTDEAKGYAAKGSPEAQLVSAIPPEGATKGALKAKLGDAFDVGMKAAARNKWIGFEKGNKDLVLRKVENFKDELQEQLKRLENGEVIPDEVINDLKRRKLITKDGDWKDLEFKDYNYAAQGQPIAKGYVREAIENIFFMMGIHVFNI
nr:unnamed protein product [Digitaria exilis]